MLATPPTSPGVEVDGNQRDHQPVEQPRRQVPNPDPARMVVAHSSVVRWSHRIVRGSPQPRQPYRRKRPGQDPAESGRRQDRCFAISGSKDRCTDSARICSRSGADPGERCLGILITVVTAGSKDYPGPPCYRRSIINRAGFPGAQSYVRGRHCSCGHHGYRVLRPVARQYQDNRRRFIPGGRGRHRIGAGFDTPTPAPSARRSVGPGRLGAGGRQPVRSGEAKRAGNPAACRSSTVSSRTGTVTGHPHYAHARFANGGRHGECRRAAVGSRSRTADACPTGETNTAPGYCEPAAAGRRLSVNKRQGSTRATRRTHAGT